MDLLKGYTFIAKKIGPTTTTRRSPGTAALNNFASVSDSRVTKLHELSSADSYTLVPYRQVISGLGFLEILLGFVIIILQIVANGQRGQKHHEQSFMRFVEIGLFGSVSTILAGSSGFVVSREHMLLRPRYHLFLFTFVLTSWSFINDILLAFLHIGLISNAMAVLSNSTTIVNGTSLAANKESPVTSSENSSLMFGLVISLLVLLLLVSLCLACSTVVIVHNLIFSFHAYVAPREHSRARRQKSKESTGSDDSNMQTTGKDRWWAENTDRQTHPEPVHNVNGPLLAPLAS